MSELAVETRSDYQLLSAVITNSDRNMWRSIQKLIDPDFKVKEEAKPNNQKGKKFNKKNKFKNKLKKKFSNNKLSKKKKFKKFENKNYKRNH